MNRISCLSLQLGDNQNSRNLVWYNLSENKKAFVRYTKKENYLKNGFRGNDTCIAEGTVCEIYRDPKHVSCKVSIKNLSFGCEYCYQVGSENGFSGKTYCFNMPKQFSDSYNFSVFSDAHKKDPLMWKITSVSPSEFEKRSLKAWEQVLSSIKSTNPECILSLGDNISSCGMGFAKIGEKLRKTSEKEMKQFFAPQAMKEMPLASIMGNHEFSYSDKPDDYSSVTGYHFLLPHDDGVSGHCLNNSSGNFSYRLKDVLIIGLNIFDRQDGNLINTSAEINKAYAEKAISNNKDAKWKIILVHIHTYSHISGNVKTINDFLDKLCFENNIDIVFSGHAHAYSLSYQIENGVPVDVQNIEKTEKNTYKTVNPKGTLHCNVPSAMYHSFTDPSPDRKEYIRSYGLAEPAAPHFPNFEGLTYNSGCFMNIGVNNAKNTTSLSVKLVQCSDNSVLEEYIIEKSL